MEQTEWDLNEFLEELSLEALARSSAEQQPNYATSCVNGVETNSNNAHEPANRDQEQKSDEHGEQTASFDDAKLRSMTVFSVQKAGMSEDSLKRINAIVYEMSRDSPHFKHQEKLERQREKRIEEIRAKITALERTWETQPPSLLQALIRKTERYMQRLITDELIPIVEGVLKPVPFTPASQVKTQAQTAVFPGFQRPPEVRICVDMDMFFAAVEMLYRPELRNVPFAVGGMSMLSTSNYEARKYGVRAAMPGFIAMKLCPNLVLVKPNFHRYVAAASIYRSIFSSYDPNYTSYSLDEASLNLGPYLKRVYVSKNPYKRVAPPIDWLSSCSQAQNLETPMSWVVYHNQLLHLMQHTSTDKASSIFAYARHIRSLVLERPEVRLALRLELKVHGWLYSCDYKEPTGSELKAWFYDCASRPWKRFAYRIVAEEAEMDTQNQTPRYELVVDYVTQETYESELPLAASIDITQSAEARHSTSHLPFLFIRRAGARPHTAVRPAPESSLDYMKLGTYIAAELRARVTMATPIEALKEAEARRDVESKTEYYVSKRGRDDLIDVVENSDDIMPPFRQEESIQTLTCTSVSDSVEIVGVRILDDLPMESLSTQRGLTCSAGIAPTRTLAKIASDMGKPDGQYWVRDKAASTQGVLAFLDDLPTRKLPGVGRVTERILSAAVGVTKCGDLRKNPRTALIVQTVFTPAMANFILRRVSGVGSGFGEEDELEDGDQDGGGGSTAAQAGEGSSEDKPIEGNAESDDDDDSEANDMMRDVEEHDDEGKNDCAEGAHGSPGTKFGSKRVKVDHGDQEDDVGEASISAAQDVTKEDDPALVALGAKRSRDGTTRKPKRVLYLLRIPGRKSISCERTFARTDDLIKHLLIGRKASTNLAQDLEESEPSLDPAAAKKRTDTKAQAAQGRLFKLPLAQQRLYPGLAARHVTVKFKTADFEVRQRSIMLPYYIFDPMDILIVAAHLIIAEAIFPSHPTGTASPSRPSDQIGDSSFRSGGGRSVAQDDDSIRQFAYEEFMSIFGTWPCAEQLRVYMTAQANKLPWRPPLLRLLGVRLSVLAYRFSIPPPMLYDKHSRKRERVMEQTDVLKKLLEDTIADAFVSAKISPVNSNSNQTTEKPLSPKRPILTTHASDSNLTVSKPSLYSRLNDRKLRSQSDQSSIAVANAPLSASVIGIIPHQGSPHQGSPVLAERIQTSALPLYLLHHQKPSPPSRSSKDREDVPTDHASSALKSGGNVKPSGSLDESGLASLFDATLRKTNSEIEALCISAGACSMLYCPRCGQRVQRKPAELYPGLSTRSNQSVLTPKVSVVKTTLKFLLEHLQQCSQKYHVL